MYACVAVNSPGAERRTFSYRVPPGMPLEVGCAVWVPFGPRVVQGICLEVSDQPAVAETRDIAALIEPLPLLDRSQVELALWMGQRYLCPLFDAAALMMPPGFERRLVSYVQLRPGASEATIAQLTPEQRALHHLLEKKGRVPFRAVERALGQRRARAVCDQLVRKRVVTMGYQVQRPRARPKVVPHLRLAVTPEAAAELAAGLQARAPRQAALLNLLATSAPGPVPLPQARRQAGCSSQVVRALVGKGLIAVSEVREYRDPLAQRTFAPQPAPTLTADQAAAWRQVEAAIAGEAGPGAFLLHGVTGSGKTEIYLRALERAVSLGRRGIVLVPEIALTPQTIARFGARFPGRVAVLHSRLSVGEQFDEWWRVREGAFDVVIGSRGAVFAPQPDLGLIVIDEEHEWTYKQQELKPRYHARDVALKRAELCGATVILGSATPDVVTYYGGGRGDYSVLELPQRIAGGDGGERQLPPVEVVDLREELKQGNRGIFSRALAQATEQALAANEQVIFFLNRRGAATFVQCRDCGHVLRCRRCDVALTYHAQGEGLVCHQCNRRVPVPERCPQCWSRRIKYLGIGTQRVEEEAARLFPGAVLLRWDRDATAGRHSHDEILERFLSHEADVLIGTQMIAKGLELPLVTLVGVINADVGLHLPDFRAAERTFQILAQVAGRAGRGTGVGRVIVQSYNPEHYAVVCAARHDFRAFYDEEIALRRQLENPPFSRLARLVYAGTGSSQCQEEAERMHRLLVEERDSWGMADVSLIGPAPAYVSRVRGRYRWHIIVKGQDPARLLSQVPIPLGWAVDIDPVSLL